MATDALQLAHWESFYVIVGAAAGVLIGLQFVVIALQQNVTRNMGQALRAFASPTIVHLTVVLSLSAILNMPRHTRTSLGVTLLVVAAALLGYLVWVVGKARAQDLYQPDLEDWIWHYILPALAYLGMLEAGATSWRASSTALYVIAAALLSLLIVADPQRMGFRRLHRFDEIRTAGKLTRLRADPRSVDRILLRDRLLTYSNMGIRCCTWLERPRRRMRSTRWPSLAGGRSWTSSPAGSGP